MLTATRTNTRQNGFTIVELLIVITAITILAAITIVTYSGIQNRAYDTTIRNGVSQLEKALRLYAQDHGMAIPGSSGAVKDTNGRCIGGGSGYIGSGIGYACSIEDELIATGNLSSSFLSKLPHNTYFGAPSDKGARLYMLYPCGAIGSGLYALSYTLRSPTTDDEASLQGISDRGCANVVTQKGYGMRAAKIIQL